MMALRDGAPSGKAGFPCKHSLRAFISLFTSTCKLWVSIRRKRGGYQPCRPQTTPYPLLAKGVDRWYIVYMDYKHEHHCVHLVVYHIIWCPKRRRKILVGAVAQRLQAIIQEVMGEHAWEIMELAIQPDHVHLFVRANPNTVPNDIPRLLKGRSSHDLRDEFPELLKLPSLWTRSSFLSTAGNVSSETIQRYIAAQSSI